LNFGSAKANLYFAFQGFAFGREIEAQKLVLLLMYH
jgi:hypothetical protein